jgi:site-specific recombinase XerD
MKLHTVVTRYVAFRKSLGERFHTNEKVLKSFCRSLGKRIDVDEVRADQVDAFLAGTGPLTSSWHVKHSALLGFYRYALTRGYAKDSPLPVAIPKRPQPFVPYIYSREELRHLLEGALTYQKNRGRLEPLVVQTLLLFLYGTGLRVRESLALTQADVDLAAGVVTVRESKFFKSRLVPLGPQLLKALVTYATRRKVAGHSQDGGAPFFIARNGGPINMSTLQGNFRRIRKHVGIHRIDGACYQPRIHDLRHTFAVHRLVAWYREGAEVQRLLPHLSVYLGHAYLAATSVYLSMTPELLAEASKRFEQHALKGAVHD